MKRSIISFCIFAALTLTGGIFEIVHSNRLVSEINELTHCFERGQCEADEFKELFKDNQIINRLFFKRSVLEKFEREFAELSVYSKGSEDSQAIIERIRLYCTELENAGMF